MLRSLVLADFITLLNAACGTAAIFACLNHMDVAGRACAAAGREHLPECVDSPWLWAAFALLPLSFVADALDGLVARRSRRQSAYGGDLDSLADIVSFGVAPAVVGFTLGLRGGWDALVLIYFVACGIARLARFNVTAEALTTDSGKVSHFEGTPIPTSLAVVLVLFVAWRGHDVGAALWLGEHRFLGATFHPLVLLYAVSGTMMVSRVRIPKP
ncbi:MAG: CDP-diacylglycerol--serine O-phosphatidyltransferase [Deltaproteobacteria bacterium]|nr:MAG: CDP-diacylglycerol--serine O-phosphatidyltransferase [Deltaproteobacteria bacterium]